VRKTLTLDRNSILCFVHPNRIWNYVLFFDFNKNFHAYPNNKIGNEDHFLSILDLEFSVQFISEQKFLHPNRPLYTSTPGSTNHCGTCLQRKILHMLQFIPSVLHGPRRQGSFQKIEWTTSHTRFGKWLYGMPKSCHGFPPTWVTILLCSSHRLAKHELLNLEKTVTHRCNFLA
jgi:hypothetical protein